MTGFLNREHRVLIVAEKESVNDLVNKNKKSFQQSVSSLAFYNLDGCYGMFSENGKLVERPLSCHSPADGIVKIIRETNSNEVFIATHLSYLTVVDTMLSFRRNGVKFMFSPEAYASCTGFAGRTNGWILPAVDLRTGNLPLFTRIAKRCMDIFVSLSLLIAFSPILFIISILIKLTSSGPVFFTQIRCGHNGRLFKIYKFRSMVADAEKILPKIIDLDRLNEPVFKIKNDPRVTPLGKILRKTSIDELPQLFNVLKGDLSIVGPRPEEISMVKRYNAHFKERLKVKPGVTGLQQVICRGSTSMKERMKYDLAYIKEHSLWLDIKILFKTIRVVLLQKRAT
jgi:exopolysaccharide biosynthesis polyprenyl glycosylphosphotransferase